MPLGGIALRTRRHTFVVITIAIFFIFQLLAFNLRVTNGSSGLSLPIPPWTGNSSTCRSITWLAILLLAGHLLVGPRLEVRVGAAGDPRR